MSGARLTVIDQISDALRSLTMGLQRPRALLVNLGELLVQSTRDRILSEEAPDGSAWAPLNPEYAKTKRGGGILREAGMSGGLISTIVWQIAGDMAIEVGTSRIYGAIHQLGGVIRPKTAAALVFQLGAELIHAQSVTIPARPYLGISPADGEDMLDLAADYVDGLLAGRTA